MTYGPPEIFGGLSAKPWFQLSASVCSSVGFGVAACAGSSGPNSDFQSENGCLNVTVTVWLFGPEPSIDWIEVYPTDDATSQSLQLALACQTYLKSSALIGTPSDQTAFGLIL